MGQVICVVGTFVGTNRTTIRKIHNPRAFRPMFDSAYRRDILNKSKSYSAHTPVLRTPVPPVPTPRIIPHIKDTTNMPKTCMSY